MKYTDEVGRFLDVVYGDVFTEHVYISSRVWRPVRVSVRRRASYF